MKDAFNSNSYCKTKSIFSGIMSQTEVATVENDIPSQTASDAGDDTNNVNTNTSAGIAQTNCQSNDNDAPGKDSFCFSDINPANLEYL